MSGLPDAEMQSSIAHTLSRSTSIMSWHLMFWFWSDFRRLFHLLFKQFQLVWSRKYLKWKLIFNPDDAQKWVWEWIEQKGIKRPINKLVCMLSTVRPYRFHFWVKGCFWIWRWVHFVNFSLSTVEKRCYESKQNLIQMQSLFSIYLGKLPSSKA